MNTKFSYYDVISCHGHLSDLFGIQSGDEKNTIIPPPSLSPPSRTPLGDSATEEAENGVANFPPNLCSLAFHGNNGIPIPELAKPSTPPLGRGGFPWSFPSGRKPPPPWSFQEELGWGYSACTSPTPPTAILVADCKCGIANFLFSSCRLCKSRGRV